MIRCIGAAFLIALLLPTVALGQESTEFILPTMQPQEGAGSGLTRQLDETHAAWSRQVQDLGVRLDRLFGGTQFVPDRSSYIRVSTTLLVEEDSTEFEPRLRARLALPNTERRLSLVLESDDDEQFDRGPGAGDPSPPVLLRPEDDQGFTAGLRYLRRLGNALEFDADAGIRVRAPPDPFVRARIGRSFFSGLWEFRPSEELYWRYHRGVGARTQVLAQRALAGPQFFRSISEADWVHREQQFYYAQDFIFSHEFTPLNAVQARIGGRGESSPHRLETWFVNIGWRRNIYKRWLFAEVRPELLFEREDDFRAEPRIFLTLEAYFGDVDWPGMEVRPE